MNEKNRLQVLGFHGRFSKSPMQLDNANLDGFEQIIKRIVMKPGFPLEEFLFKLCTEAEMRTLSKKIVGSKG